MGVWKNVRTFASFSAAQKLGCLEGRITNSVKHIIISYFIDRMEIFKDIFAKIEAVKAEKPTAGTRFRLMGLVADIAEVTQVLQRDVLDVVSHEAVLDADADYAELAEQVLAAELQECVDVDESVCEQTRQVNEALGVLNSVLVQIPEQLERHHKEDEFERLYEAEKRRYLSSGTAYRSRKTFEQWRDDACYGHPLQENIEDYRLEKLLKMFEKGVLASQVEHIQRAKRYPGEVDFEQLDEDHPMKKTAHKHYAALRKLVDWRDGCLVVIPARVGHFFYMCRHEENAKANRTRFLEYMHKVELAQEELRKLQQVQEVARNTADGAEQLNFFAPSKHLKVLLADEWFSLLTTNEGRYNQEWTDGLVEALMHSEWGELIAREWTVKEKRLTLKCMIVGVLKDAGVLKGSYNQIAKLLDLDSENPATLAKYLGMGKKQGYADWILDYAKK